MDLDTIREWFTLDHISALIQQYRSFGPIPGILLPMLEAFLPFLPLVVFVLANATAFGLWWGFLFSWIGAVAGSFLIFWIIRRYGQMRFFRFLQKHKQVQRLMVWVESHGFGPLFILLCFPFTPSAIVNIVAGLSKVSPLQYGLAVVGGKAVMIFTISFVGYDLVSLIHKPVRTIIIGIVIFILWFVGKRLEVRLNKSMKREDGQ
ncbi:MULTISPECIES: TVP38/TMEM64 family protein [Peribacillus]|uniref:TVP38/TMEM64 family membrane protein n=1 Tax=Peribacillus simplex TaxID=1478 RepID=A0A9W4KVM4_9BACI|nr:TVP38/TMEM64 family protein [Peribacillus simplex]MDR4927123.1 TVP38/TMEM64 family protein [Peribacillus simplex]WHX92409.1 TVP38/TMEM64 family protein [Peribacillus simplex]CAH0159634.1 TVP38/TMEM64 family inner membrane protein YdjZ [Peribacillus simplex]